MAEANALIKKLKAGDAVKVVNNEDANVVLNATFKCKSLLDGGLVVAIVDAKKGAAETQENASITEVFNGGKVKINDGAAIDAKADFAQAMADFVDGFANFANGSTEPMTRAENETGTGNSLGLRLFTKMVQMGSYEVTGSVTRQQLQDLPLYGVDAVGKIMEAMQNELTQHINARILERVFRLGVTNAAHQYYHNGTDLNLYIGAQAGDEVKALSDFAGIKEYNELEVRVSNTAANEYYYTKTFDKWPSWMLTPYHEKCQIFHKDSLESGLFGPVKILY
jgi:hypothetical protein